MVGGGRALAGGDGHRAGPRVARVLGEGCEAVDVYDGERVPGQNFDCYAVRFGRKRGVFMNWADVLAQTTGYKGASSHCAMSPDDAAYFVRRSKLPSRSISDSGGGGGGAGISIDATARAYKSKTNTPHTESLRSRAAEKPRPRHLW